MMLMREEPRKGTERKTTLPDQTNPKLPDRRNGYPLAPFPMGGERTTMDDD